MSAELETDVIKMSAWRFAAEAKCTDGVVVALVQDPTDDCIDMLANALKPKAPIGFKQHGRHCRLFVASRKEYLEQLDPRFFRRLITDLAEHSGVSLVLRHGSGPLRMTAVADLSSEIQAAEAS